MSKRRLSFVLAGFLAALVVVAALSYKSLALRYYLWRLGSAYSDNWWTNVGASIPANVLPDGTLLQDHTPAFAALSKWCESGDDVVLEAILHAAEQTTKLNLCLNATLLVNNNMHTFLERGYFSGLVVVLEGARAYPEVYDMMDGLMLVLPEEQRNRLWKSGLSLGDDPNDPAVRSRWQAGIKDCSDWLDSRWDKLLFDIEKCQLSVQAEAVESVSRPNEAEQQRILRIRAAWRDFDGPRPVPIGGSRR